MALGRARRRDPRRPARRRGRRWRAARALPSCWLASTRAASSCTWSARACARRADARHRARGAVRYHVLASIPGCVLLGRALPAGGAAGWCDWDACADGVGEGALPPRAGSLRPVVTLIDMRGLGVASVNRASLDVLAASPRSTRSTTPRTCARSTYSTRRWSSRARGARSASSCRPRRPRRCTSSAARMTTCRAARGRRRSAAAARARQRATRVWLRRRGAARVASSWTRTLRASARGAERPPAADDAAHAAAHPAHASRALSAHALTGRRRSARSARRTRTRTVRSRPRYARASGRERRTSPPSEVLLLAHGHAGLHGDHGLRFACKCDGIMIWRSSSAGFEGAARRV